MDSITLNEPSPITAPPLTSTPDINNTGVGTAAISSVSGGTPPYNYNWTPSGGTDSTASGLTVGTYTVTVTDNNGCDYIDSISVSNTTGISEFNVSNFTFNVYPNPSKGLIILDIENPEESNVEIEIYNVFGEVVYTKHLTIQKIKEELDIKSLTDGIYMIKLQTESFSENKRIVITK